MTFEMKIINILLFVGKSASQLEEFTHLTDVIQSCSEEPYKVNLCCWSIFMIIGIWPGAIA